MMHRQTTKCLQHSNAIASCYSSIVGFYSWADNLTGFSLIMPYTMIRPMPENVKTSRLCMYGANAKQVNSYFVDTPDKVIVPDSP